MKTRVHLQCILSIFLCTLFLFGCQNQRVEQPNENYESAIEKDTICLINDFSNNLWDIIHLTTKLESVYDADQEQPFDLPEAGLENVIVSQVIAENPDILYYLLSCQAQEQAPYNAYLAVETAESTYLYDLKIACYDQSMYVCDVDGDTTDEIIIQQIVGLTGGAGQYLSRIFKFESDSLQEIFNSDTSLPAGKDNQFDTGYDSVFLPNYQLKITNRYADCNVIIDISGRYISEIFDENGKCTENESVWCDSFFTFAPKDIDQDGVFEIECMQYVSLFSHADGIGYAKSILSYNQNTGVFQIVEADFVDEL